MYFKLLSTDKGFFKIIKYKITIIPTQVSPPTTKWKPDYKKTIIIIIITSFPYLFSVLVLQIKIHSLNCPRYFRFFL